MPSLNLKNSKNASVFYVQEDGKIGIGLTSPAASLHVLGNDGMVFSGNFGSGIQLNPGAGVNMIWYPRKGAFRAGGVEGSQWDDKSIGVYSLATGYMTIASGDYSVALGTNSIASGQSSIAMGRNSISDNFFSTAIGFYASALGESSFSLGYHTLASGKYSFAMGYKASTNEHEGSFCFSDASSQRDMASEANNEMTMRFAGGYRLFSNKTASLGVILNKESNSWASVLDSKKMENFTPVSAEDVLKKISLIKAGSFNFKGSGNKEKRHYGASAQEFYRYFGKDTLGIVGSDTTISTGDFDGITLLALQGLEKRTTTVNSSLAQIDTLVQELKNKDSLITKLKDDVDFLQNKMKEKEEEYQKLSEKLDLLEETVNSLHGVKGRKPE
ncbi:MAG: hypothetical protein Q8933_06950 [Bacteroidota bacterium]|nr:hypothetical protein [Bacteroidota bacterium]MDP4196966.1 hypothetical protein [Bacteroidota bacterium]